MLKKLVIFFSFFIISKVYAQQLNLSVYAQASIVTVGPGTNLYEAFGHTTIRIQDPVLQLDIAYNYGIFDFNAPNFYTNFTKGRLIYKLARYPFHYFLRSNLEDKRWVKEQILNLDQSQVQALFKYLENNAREENASYLYDPFFNNCASKPMDILQSLYGDSVTLDTSYVSKNASLRSLMNSEIHWDTWSNLGINLALGNTLDRSINAKEYLYLPDYVYAALKGGKIVKDNNPIDLVKKENLILDFPEIKPSRSDISPFIIFSIIALLGIWRTFKDYQKQSISRWVDLSVFSITGLLGVFLLFLWFFTDHSTTGNNFNILWCFPLNIILFFMILKKKTPNWIRNYYRCLLFCMIALIPIHLANMQGLPLAVSPLFVFLAIRYYFLVKTTAL